MAVYMSLVQDARGRFSASQLSTPPKPVGAVWSAARDKPGDRALTAAFISASRAPADNLPGCSYQTLKGSRDRARSTRREPSGRHVGND